MVLIILFFIVTFRCFNAEFLIFTQFVCLGKWRWYSKSEFNW